MPGSKDADGPAALDLEPIDGRDLGGVWVLDQLWSKLGIDREIRKLARPRQTLGWMTPSEKFNELVAMAA